MYFFPGIVSFINQPENYCDGGSKFDFLGGGGGGGGGHNISNLEYYCIDIRDGGFINQPQMG